MAPWCYEHLDDVFQLPATTTSIVFLVNTHSFCQILPPPTSSSRACFLVTTSIFASYMEDTFHLLTSEE
ncbi:hypothetical protein VNO77_00970 [Canavalia gladiata]|uniref:Uncharacterized protein n=1 Tax=Canavalia gladiata TaxID=3824 RepID=A0AAN9MR31_CANGL